MRDCWLDPYGNVYYVEPFGHERFAREQLSDEFPMRMIQLHYGKDLSG